MSFQTLFLVTVNSLLKLAIPVCFEIRETGAISAEISTEVVFDVELFLSLKSVTQKEKLNLQTLCSVSYKTRAII